jgi:sarcosine oxidase subunit beta
MMGALIAACEGGQDHDRQPVSFRCEVTGNDLDIGHYSRFRQPADTTMSVLG